ncbi:1-acyl-sn-glycerol-3-phosphate acyltransferase [Venenivibrio stagnispumantis]|uniref:Lyso-ornithine lipid acyltransferase n=1 Tax=Venenivibrio stagnispumantis TaxID=407998 RepID=A0AA45WPH4_9AQUI|nr:lysophospholipid acyltransferase family protein [Venenivibrio stagnispumantis]MCW4572678.1 1-acyl-sn-glycerol-3-phosphate acyltransferase [Venenivibrio stagnispumantis]SMP21477.1 lyso-ornithine lipid acyltransferase [Venenivibrio stagnispumantis]
MVIRLTRIPALIFLYILFLFTSSIIYILVKDKKRNLIKNASLFSKITLSILNIKLKVEGSFDKSKNFLIVANHLSYLDILVLFSLNPSIFVSTKEVEEDFLLGLTAKLGGAVFIERRNFNNLKNEIDMITNLLKDGYNVVIFPEGTTSDGSCIFDFKAPFLISSKLSKREILPICINYTRINKEPINKINKDFIFYYGDMKFFEHVWKLLSLKSIEIELKILSPIDSTNLNRKDISNISKETIERYFKKVI